MPVFLDKKKFPLWLSKDSSEKDLLQLLKPAPSDLLQTKEVPAVREGMDPFGKTGD
jgi:putative SOS response-associated peptidase YedK